MIRNVVMGADQYIEDCDFESLVSVLQMIADKADKGPIERWEIRIALAEHGILPVRMAGERDAAALAASLRRSTAAA